MAWRDTISGTVLFGDQPVGAYWEQIADRPANGGGPYMWDNVQRAWVTDATAQAQKAATASQEAAIKGAIYGQIQPATIDQLKAMDDPTYNAWFDKNVTTAPVPQAAAIAVLRLFILAIIRRVL